MRNMSPEGTYKNQDEWTSWVGAALGFWQFESVLMLRWILMTVLLNSSPPSARYMRQWISIGSDNGLSPIRRQAII